MTDDRFRGVYDMVREFLGRLDDEEQAYDAPPADGEVMPPNSELTVDGFRGLLAAHPSARFVHKDDAKALLRAYDFVDTNLRDAEARVLRWIEHARRMRNAYRDRDREAREALLAVGCPLEADWTIAQGIAWLGAQKGDDVERKRRSVGVASTVLDPLPSTSTTDTALLIAALDSAREVLAALSDAVTLSPHALRAEQACRDALTRIRERINTRILDGEEAVQ